MPTSLRQPFEPPPPAEPWADLPQVLALAARDNVSIKISGACTLSHEPFRYNDIWDPSRDWTRATELLSFKQGVDAFRIAKRLSDSDKAALMGGTLTKVHGWSPS